MFNARFDYAKYKHIRQETSCFGEWTYPDACTKEVVYKDLSRFRVSELTWLTVGDWIINAYDESYGDPENLIRIHTWRDLLIREEKPESPEQPPVANLQQQQQGENNNNSNGNSDHANSTVENATGNVSDMDTTEGNNVTAASAVARSSDESSDVKTDSDKDKPKKRRGSDLSFLEQWGWHKNRRYSRKRAMPTEPVAPLEDMSIGTFLKQVFAKYYHVTFDEKESPFEPEPTEIETEMETRVTNNTKEEKRTSNSGDPVFKAPPTEQETDFQKLTQSQFDEFLNEFEYFDLIPLIYKWLEYVSGFWGLAVPPQIGQQYVRIYSYYLTHYAFQPWAGMSCDEFKTVYGMALSHVEWSIELVQQQKGVVNRSELVTEEFVRLRHQLMFHSGYYCLSSPEEYVVRVCRYHWCNYLLGRMENNLEQCLQVKMAKYY